MTSEHVSIQFPLGAEGPFYRLQIALRLISVDQPHVTRRIIAALTIAWSPLALLWWWQYRTLGSTNVGAGLAGSPFTHIATYARFFVTVPLLIAAENAVRPHLERAFRQAVIIGVVPPQEQGQFFTLLLGALRWRESRRAEAVIMGLAYLAAHLATTVATQEHYTSWIHTGPTLTWAGCWYAYVSLPLLQFMVFRWCYRLLIWWRIMYAISRMNLNIQPAHPDLRGGLAFLGDSLQAFGILALAFSSTAAGAVADYVLNEGAPISELKGFIAGAALFVLSLFLAPLGFFFAPLVRAKDEALLHYEGLAERFWQALDLKWRQALPSPPQPDHIAVTDFSALADLAVLVKTIREMKSIPVTKEGLMPLLIAIVLPFLPVLAMAFPLEELLAGVLHVFMGRAE